MRVIYNGYAIMTYGKNRLCISNQLGQEVFTTADRSSIIKAETEDELRQYLKQFLKDRKHATGNSH